MRYIYIYSPRNGVAEELERLIRGFDETAGLSLEINAYQTIEDLLGDASKAPVDFLYFDTEQCPDLKTRLNWISQAFPVCSLALLGDDEKNAVFGYAVRAMEYMTLPVDEDEFLCSLAELLRERVRRVTEFIPVKLHGIWQQIRADRVSYIRSDGHSLYFHMDDGKSLRVAVGSFHEYESLLSLHTGFFRCHKSYVANAEHVRKWDRFALTMDNGEQIAVSRPYRSALRSFYAAYEAGDYQQPSR